MRPPDGDLGGLGEPDGALQARVNLSHLHGSFQAHHLEPTVAQICDDIKQQVHEAVSGSGNRCISFCRVSRYTATFTQLLVNNKVNNNTKLPLYNHLLWP